MLDSMEWKIPAGNTSNYCRHYYVHAVAETDTGDIITIIISYDGNHRYDITPIRTYEDGTAAANYGTPTFSDRFVGAIEKFNKNILSSREYGCKLGIIQKMVLKNGKLFKFSIEDGHRVGKPGGEVMA